MKPLKTAGEFFKRAGFLSPADLLQRAGAITAIFLILHMAGCREFTSILNGTIGSVTAGWKTSAFFGVLYVVFYLGVVVAVPIMVLGAALLAGWQRWRERRGTHPSLIAPQDENLAQKTEIS